MSASFSVMVIGVPPIRDVEVQYPVTFARLVSAVASAFDLSPSLLNGIVFRWVSEEPSVDDAESLFLSAAENSISKTAQLPTVHPAFIVARLATTTGVGTTVPATIGVPDVSSLQLAVADISAKLDSVASTVQAVSGKVEAVSGKVEAVSGEVKVVSGEVKVVSGEVKVVSGEVKVVSGEMASLRTQMMVEDATSFQSPTGKQYERLVDTKIDSWLAECCGLQVSPQGRRSIPETDPAARRPGASNKEKMQWDARFSVTCLRGWTAPAAGAPGPQMLVYGGKGSFMRPLPLAAARKMSPTKPGHEAEYFAVLEYTRMHDWTFNTTVAKDDGTPVRVRKSLLPRLEQRLHVCMERFKAAGNACTSVLDAVALVGVVGEDTCQDSVEARLSAVPSPHPLLTEMLQAGRFVFFYCAAMLPVGPAALAQGSGGPSS